MLVLIDVGNTRCKYLTVFQGQRSQVTYCENDKIADNWLTETFLEATEVILANVNDDEISNIISSWADKRAIAFQLLNTCHQQFELTCAYENPSKLGIDRWLVMLAASFLFPQKACLVIDAGTATTLDVIPPRGQHLGGWIMPGIELLFNSLVDNTNKIDATKNNIPSLLLGESTSDCVNNGAWALTLGAIALQQKSLKALYPELEIIITGGNSQRIASLIDYSHHVIDELVFIGMQRFSN